MLKVSLVARVAVGGGLGLLMSVALAAEFGQIRFVGTVREAACYVYGSLSQTRYLTTRRLLNTASNHFNVNFSDCRVVDKGFVLADVSLSYPQGYSVQLQKTDGHYHPLSPLISSSGLASSLSQVLDTSSKILRFQYSYLAPTTGQSIGVEIKYR